MGMGGRIKRIFIRPAPKDPLKLHKESWWARFPSFWTMILVLLLITLAGGWFRYWHIGQQSYWHDESRTIGKLAKTYPDMMNELAREHGFTPTWFVFLRYWQEFTAYLTGSVAKSFSPEYIRIPPVFFGTLMIPAMYFLARQFTDRKGALLVALLAAVNPYWIYYSRDIKMYMTCWCFLAWHLGFLFAWMSSRSKLRSFCYWMLMALTGAIAIALHSNLFPILIIELIWLLTRPRLKALDAPLWLAAVAVMLILPIWWYTTSSQWLVGALEGGRTGSEWNKKAFLMEWPTIWGLGSVQLLGFFWPKALPNAQLHDWHILGDAFDKHLATRTLPWLVEWQRWIIYITGGILSLGLVPWRNFGHARKLPPDLRNWLIILVGGLSGFCTGLIIWVVRFSGSSEVLLSHQLIDKLHQLPWSGMLLPTWYGLLGALGGMLLVLVLCLLPWRSTETPLELQQKATSGRWWWIAIWIVLPVAAYASTWLPHKIIWLPGNIRTHQDSPWYTLFWGWLYKSNPNGIDEFWEPRYLGLIVPALVLWLGACLRRLPFWPLRTVAILFILTVSVISALSNHLIYRQEPFGPTAAVIRQYWKANDGSIALITPEEAYSDEMDRLSYELPLNIPPQSNQSERDLRTYRGGGSSPSAQQREKIFQIKNWKRNARDEEYIGFLYRIKRDPKIQTIIITDRNGDLTDSPFIKIAASSKTPGLQGEKLDLTNPSLPDEAVQKILGKDWKLDHSETYRWYYEWRYYFFHVWRTRVWIRRPAPVIAPLSQPGAFPSMTQTRPSPRPTIVPTTNPNSRP